MCTININGHLVGNGYPAYIVAEIGINHNGEVGTAMELIKQAKQAGADAAKFQIVTAARCYTQSSAAHAIFKKIEMNKEQWRQLITYAKERGIDFFATFADVQDLKEYAEFSLPAIKISSTNLTNFPLLEAVAQKNKPVIISTGLSYLSEIEEAVQFLKAKGQNQIAILQCTSLYPTEAKDVNLLALETFKQTFPGHPVGFSDHTIGTTCAIAAVAMGAKIIEKHFTLDKRMPGGDHRFSATPDEMQQLVASVREVEKARGSKIKEPTANEIPLREEWMRSLVALKDIEEGQILTLDLIGVKRSITKGLEPKFLESALGKRTTKTLHQDEPITGDAFH